jgi:hypothetical protein
MTHHTDRHPNQDLAVVLNSRTAGDDALLAELRTDPGRQRWEILRVGAAISPQDWPEVTPGLVSGDPAVGARSMRGNTLSNYAPCPRMRPRGGRSQHDRKASGPTGFAGLPTPVAAATWAEPSPALQDELARLAYNLPGIGDHSAG